MYQQSWQKHDFFVKEQTFLSDTYININLAEKLGDSLVKLTLEEEDVCHN